MLIISGLSRMLLSVDAGRSFLMASGQVLRWAFLRRLRAREKAAARDSDRPLACLQSVQVARLNFALRQEYGGNPPYSGKIVNQINADRPPPPIVPII